MLDNIKVLKNLENISKIKQREVYLPICNMKAIATPFVGADDFMLKTTVSSIESYDFELTRLLYKHLTFPTLEIENRQVSLDDFFNSMAYLDKQVALWGIFEASYGTLGKQDLTCPHCGNQTEQEILLADLIQEDSITPWDQPVPFLEYLFPVEKVVNVEGVHKIVFNTYLPTIKQHINVLSLIPPQKLKENFEKLGTVLSKVEELTSVTKSIEVYDTPECETPTSFSKLQDIHMVISRFILLDIVGDILNAYNDKFSKYVPIFRKPLNCIKCTKQYNFYADIEISLFRRFLRQ